MITFQDVTKRYGGRVLYEHATLPINPGNRIGLVGPNGAGKTTVFRLLTGEETPDAGTVTVPSKLVVGYFSQDVADMRGRSVLEEVKTGAGHVYQLAKRLEEIEKKLQETETTPLEEDAMTKLLEEYSDVQSSFERHD